MTIKLFIPTPLRPFLDGQDEVIIEGVDSVDSVLDNLVAKNKDLKSHLFNDDGSIRGFVNIYVNDTDIRELDGDKTVLKSGDEISIIPAIAGGIF